MIKRLALIAAGLIAFGWLYAYRIAIRPFPPHQTWLSVVIGDAVTDAGASAALLVLSKDRRLALVPWVAHALTGIPMIVAQLLKHWFMASDARALETYDHP
jgi:hypothetical protein